MTDGFLNDEQIHATLEALDREAEGYEARVAQAQLAKNDGAIALYENRIEQVNDEKKRVKALIGQESAVDDSASGKSKDKGKA
jgi:hypothetical protein